MLIKFWNNTTNNKIKISMEMKNSKPQDWISNDFHNESSESIRNLTNLLSSDKKKKIKRIQLDCK